MSATENKAVFLSYASQDAEAARKICEALRSGGVEVWFDAEGGLEHGDEWDAKIRKQVKECVLFLPIISVNTQAREEGYFRIEWELAAQRALGIASGVAFILPVVIDDTREPAALVPDRFRSVQWTKLPGGAVPPEVLQRFLKLWSHRTGVLKHKSEEQGARSEEPQNRGRIKSEDKPGAKIYVLMAAVILVLVATVGWWFLRAPATKPAPAPVASAPGSERMHPSSAPLTEAHRLAEQALRTADGKSIVRADLESAQQLYEKAVALDPTDAYVWAVGAEIDVGFYLFGYAETENRAGQAQFKADRALKLAPEAFSSRRAKAKVLCYVVETEAAFAEADRLIDQLLQISPEDRTALLMRGWIRQRQSRLDEAVDAYRGAHDIWAEGWALLGARRLDEAIALAERGLKAGQANPDRIAGAGDVRQALMLELSIQLRAREDLGAAQAVMDRMPAEELLEDETACYAADLRLMRREPEKVLEIMRRVPHDWMTPRGTPGPHRAVYTAYAHEMAHQPEAARVQWQAALRLVDERLAVHPDQAGLVSWRAFLLAHLGQRPEAEQALQLFEQMAGRPKGQASFDTIDTYLLLGRRQEALASLPGMFTVEFHRFWYHAYLRFDPRYDSLRGDPAFEKVLREFSPIPAKASGPPLPEATPADAKSVAVLAFANLSDDKANEYFSDGISEELLNVLAKVPGLKVSARTSAFYFKGKEVPIPEIAQKLGVAYVVEGSVRKQGDKVRITAQLIKAADGFHVWSDTFTRDLKDIFALQDEIAGLIAKALSLKLGMALPAAAATVNPEALRLYLEGRQAWNQRTEEALARADVRFRRALELEPNFARALSGLADVGAIRPSIPGQRLVQREEVVAQAERAIALDATLAEPHATLGVLAFMEWNFAAADRHFQRAFALNPSYAWAHLWRGQSMLTQGRMEEAMAENQRALEADPLAPRIASNTALFFLLAGQPADALASAERSLSLLPSEHQAQTWKAEALLMLGRTEDALKIAREALATEPSRRDFTYVLARAGNPQEVAAAIAAPDPRFMNRTRSLLAAGRVNEALAGLEADARNSVFSFQFALFHPAFDAIRKEPRFVKMLETLRMTEAHARAQAWRAAHPPVKSQANTK